MSTLVLDTITGKSTSTTVTIGSTPVVSASANSMTIRGEGSVQTSIQQGLAKGFIFTNQITAVDSFNMSATTDHQTGDYTNSITNNMGSATWNHMHNAGLEGETYGLYLEKSGTSKTSGAVRFQTNSHSNSRQDASQIQQVCFGDLA